MRFSKVLLALSVAVLSSSLALAQPPEGKGKGDGKGKGGRAGQMMRGFGSAALLGNPSVQEELKITDDQKEKIREAGRSLGEKMRDLQDKDPEDREVARKEIMESGDKAIKDILKPEQYKRLTEIRWQQAPMSAFMESEFQTALKLSEDQKEKLKGIAEESRKDMREIGQEARGREVVEKMQALRKEVKEKSLNVLSAEQKAEYEKMVGKPFELKVEMRGQGDGKGKERGKGKGKDKDGEPKPKVDD